MEPVQKIWKVVAASSAGTMIEWYDFYIFGSLATILATQFYPEGSPTANFLKTLATFAVGFAVRPLGALVFGRIGDMVGRKFAFLLTLLIMGGSTAAIGLLPPDISVKGSGSKRLAEGLWMKEDATAEMPEQVSDVTEIEVA